MIPEVKRWYAASYGCTDVIGQCVAVGERHVLLRFRAGSPFRTLQVVHRDRLIMEAPDPRFWGLFELLFGAQRRKGGSEAEGAAGRRPPASPPAGAAARSDGNSTEDDRAEARS